MPAGAIAASGATAGACVSATDSAGAWAALSAGACATVRGACSVRTVFVGEDAGTGGTGVGNATGGTSVGNATGGGGACTTGDGFGMGAAS